MPDSAVNLVDKWGKRYQNEYMNWIKQYFAWDNNEYNILEEEVPHADIPTKFPGIILDQKDDVEPVSELLRKLPKNMSDGCQKLQECRRMAPELQERRGTMCILW